MRAVLLLALILLLPSIVAEEPEDATSVWTAQQGDQSLLNFTIEPRLPKEGEQIQATLAFDPDFAIQGITYQICNVGESCFAIGVPVDDLGDGRWHVDTTDLPDHVAFMDEPRRFEAGERIGMQFFIDVGGDEPIAFPHGDECDYNASYQEFKACQETHYLAVDIQEADRGVPTIGTGAVVLGLLALAVTRRE